MTILYIKSSHLVLLVKYIEQSKKIRPKYMPLKLFKKILCNKYHLKPKLCIKCFILKLQLCKNAKAIIL
jgi:hypothetical protein